MTRRRWTVLLVTLAVLLSGSIAGTLAYREHLAEAAREHCPEGYVKLSREYLHELAAGTSEAATEAEAELEAEAEFEGEDGEESEEEREHEGPRYCLRDDMRKPEPFADLMKANGAAMSQLGLTRPDALARAIAQKAALASSSVPGTAGTWSTVGTGPVVFDNPDYNNNAFGLSKGAGRISAYAYNTGSKAVYASVANGGVWKSTDTGTTWTSIGDNLPTQIVGGLGWTSAGGPSGTLIALTGDNAFGGFTFSGAGIYWSTDEGAHWTKAGGAPDGAMGFRVAVDPGHPATVYAATGFGLFRSTDVGHTWADVVLPTGTCAGASTTKPGCFLANVVTDVVVRGADTFGNADGAVTAAVGWRAGQRHNPDGSIQAPNNGIYTSATGVNGSFAKVADGNGFPDTVNVGRVALGGAYGPDQDHNYLYALVQDAETFNNGTIEGIDTATLDPLGTGLVTAPTYLNGVYVSDDFGHTWTLMSDSSQFLNPANGSSLAQVSALGFGPGVQSWYNEWIQPDPYAADPILGAPTRLDLGLEEIWETQTVGTPQIGPTNFKAVAPYSTYGGGCILVVAGEACSTVHQTTGVGTTHPDQHAAMFLPGSSTTLLVGNDGGNYVAPVPLAGNFLSTDFGEGNQTGFNTLLPYSVAVAKDGTVYAGLQDNGTVKIDPTTHEAYEVYGGDGTYALVDPDDSNQAMFAPAGGSAVVTHDGGRTSTSVYPDAKDPQFLTPFIMDDDSNATIMYAAGDIWMADSTLADLATDSFQKVFDLGTAQHPGDGTATGTETDPPNLTTAAGLKSGTAYVGFCGSCDPVKENRRFHAGLATNVGGTWHVAAGTGLPQRIINTVKVDPSDVNTVYVGLGTSTVRPYAPAHALGDDGVDPTGGYVYKSTDGGQTFTDITGDLPQTGVTALQVAHGQLIAGTTIGVFASATTDGGAWGSLGGNLPAAPVMQIALDPSDPDQIYAASYGRGIYRYTFVDPVPADTTAPDAPVILVPAAASTTADQTPVISGTAEAGATVEVTDELDRTVCTTTADGAGAFSCTSITLAPGVHTLTATATDAADNTSAASAPRSFTVDIDADDDGLTDAQEAQLGTDPHRKDTDQDGLRDAREVRYTHTDPLKKNTDGDALGDGREVNVTHTNPLKKDTDGDGLGDGREVNGTHTNPRKKDTDGDGAADGREVNAGSDPLDPHSTPRHP